jgi:hypothetical protein
MAVLRLDRSTTGPAGTRELPTQHAALVAAVKDAFPGLMETQPVPGREAADPGGRRDPRRRTWPAPPPTQLPGEAGRATAAKPGDEQA